MTGGSGEASPTAEEEAEVSATPVALSDAKILVDSDSFVPSVSVSPAESSGKFLPLTPLIQDDIAEPEERVGGGTFEERMLRLGGPAGDPARGTSRDKFSAAAAVEAEHVREEEYHDEDGAICFEKMEKAGG